MSFKANKQVLEVGHCIRHLAVKDREDFQNKKKDCGDDSIGNDLGYLAYRLASRIKTG